MPKGKNRKKKPIRFETHEDSTPIYSNGNIVGFRFGDTKYFIDDTEVSEEEYYRRKEESAITKRDKK